jgi:hypothetical protein
MWLQTVPFSCTLYLCIKIRNEVEETWHSLKATWCPVSQLYFHFNCKQRPLINYNLQKCLHFLCSWIVITFITYGIMKIWNISYTITLHWANQEVTDKRGTQYGASVAQSSQQSLSPLRSWVRFSLLTHDIYMKKSQSTLYTGFSLAFPFPSTVNIDRRNIPNWPFHRSCAPWLDTSQKAG